MVVSEEHKVMLKRNIIYTGVTRAKQNVALIGQTEALNTAILNNQTDVRTPFWATGFTLRSR